MNISIQNNFLKATINSKGAELNSLVKIADEKEYIWEIDNQFWNKTSPVLFPIVGILKNNCYFYENLKYEMPRHGFARENEFEVKQISSSEVHFILHSSSETLKIYPFEFELQLQYALINSELILKYIITNNSTKTLPFAIGAHPAFALQNSNKKYSLVFEKQETLSCFTLQNELLTDTFYQIELNNKILPLEKNTFENDALIFKKIKSKKVSVLEDNSPILSVHFNDFTSLGIWSKVGAPFICIEPWNGYADTTLSNGNIIDKEGIILLKPNKKHDCSFTIEIL